MKSENLGREFEIELLLHDLKYEFAKTEDPETRLAILQLMKHYMNYVDYVDFLLLEGENVDELQKDTD